jgi:preprotein translocase subunit YajC
MNLIISNAYAQSAPAGGGTSMLLMLLIFFAIMYFMIIRPQTKRAREHKQLVTSLSKGNEITINGGLMGKISQVNETSVVLEIASGVEVKVQKNSVTNVLPKGTLKSTA